MIKPFKYLFSALLILVGLFAVLAFDHLNEKPKENQSAIKSTVSTDTTKETKTFDFAQLQEKEGDDLKDLGTWQIETIIFKGKTKAILTTANGKEVSFPIEITNQDQNEITLPTVNYAPKNLIIAQQVGLAQKNNHYFMYIPNH
ncbi:hypothetical protein [Enterococcus gallinarum]|uniref:hypothetical protein n=1 Tax=Enterococcus gallinarum TaxID=1353 RepID=UPI00288F990C|nr:hypothetical protein [Enterococcus gallinarum]MDT2680029.1 hypothetical protein [Enterococcus gallinarum]MDT2684663.1 hypothetical protein [Enterococcus gallinarum]